MLMLSSSLPGSCSAFVGCSRGLSFQQLLGGGCNVSKRAGCQQEQLLRSLEVWDPQNPSERHGITRGQSGGVCKALSEGAAQKCICRLAMPAVRLSQFTVGVCFSWCICSCRKAA